MTDDTIETASNISPIKASTLVIHDVAEPAAMTAPDRLLAYEDDLFGKDAVRIRGQVERGYGSKFKEMTEGQARHYAALERLVVTEQALADAHTALIDAEAAHQAAEGEVTDSEAGIHAASGE